MKPIGKAIKEIMKEKKISLNRMANDLGIDPASLFRSLKDGGNPTWERISQILEYLDYDVLLKPNRKRRKQAEPVLTSPKKEEREQDGDKKIG